MTQTKFKAEDGLLVRGQANLTGNTLIGGALALSANLELSADTSVGGNVVPTSNVTYDLGTSNKRWRRLFANSISTANTIEITGQANLYGGAHLRADLSFSQNNYLVGNTTAMPIIYSSNTFIYDTLRVAGTSGDPYLIVNSSITQINSNAVFKGETLSIGDGQVTFGAADAAPLTISTSSASPTTLHEFTKATGINAVKYFVFAKNNTTNAVQCSEVTLMYHSASDTAYISESNIMHSSDSPFLSFVPATSTTLVRLQGHASHASINISILRTMVV